MNSKNNFIERNLHNKQAKKKETDTSTDRVDSPDFIAKRRNKSANIILRKFSFSEEINNKNVLTKKERQQQQIKQKIDHLNHLSKQQLIKKIFDQKIHYQKIIMYLNQSIEQKKDKINQQKVQIKLIKKQLIQKEKNDEIQYLKMNANRSNDNSKQNSFNILSQENLKSSSNSIQTKDIDKLDSINTKDTINSNDKKDILKNKNNFYSNFFILLENDKLSSSDIIQFQSYIEIQNNLNELKNFNILRNLNDIKEIQLQYKFFVIFFDTMIKQNRLHKLINICGLSFIVQSIDLLWQIFEKVNLQQRDSLLHIYNKLYQIQREQNNHDKNQIQNINKSLQTSNNELLTKRSLNF